MLTHAQPAVQIFPVGYTDAAQAHHPHAHAQYDVFQLAHAYHCHAVHAAQAHTLHQPPHQPLHHDCAGNVLCDAPRPPQIAVREEKTEFVQLTVGTHHVPTVIVYACGVTITDALYSTPHAPHHPGAEFHQPHQPHTTNAFTVAIIL